MHVYMEWVECVCMGRGCVYTEWVECVCMWRGCVYMEGVECVYMLEREDEGVECAHWEMCVYETVGVCMHVERMCVYARGGVCVHGVHGEREDVCIRNGSSVGT